MGIQDQRRPEGKWNRRDEEIRAARAERATQVSSQGRCASRPEVWKEGRADRLAERRGGKGRAGGAARGQAWWPRAGRSRGGRAPAQVLSCR